MDLSVIIPVYNVEDYVERCVKSVLQQKCELEIILVNDGSTDGSKNILDTLESLYPDIVHVYSKKNGGLSDARNFGLRYAKGNYTCFLDSDDYIEPNSYRQMLEEAKKNNKLIVESDYYIDFGNKKYISKGRKIKSINEYLINGRVVVWNKIYKTKWLRKINVMFPKGLLYEDVFFFFATVSKLNNIKDVGFIDYPTVHYMQRDNSISYASGKRLLDIIQIYQLAKTQLVDDGNYEKYKAELEYKEVRNELWGYPIKKVRQIKEKKDKIEALTKLWENVSEKWPNYKSNKYLNKLSVANIYLKIINKGILINLWSRV